jgi:hypothetical protein
MSSPPLLADIFIAIVQDIQSTRYAELASTVVVVYDHLITLDGEVELIWKSSWSMGKTLFVLNRYYTLFSIIFNNYALFGYTLTDSFCLRWFQWQGWICLAACMIAQVILQMRLYALYFLNKKVLVLMVVGFLIASALSATVMGTVLSGITATPSYAFPGTPFCIAFGVPNHFFLFWVPILFFEIFLCWLALFRGFQTLNFNGSLYHAGRHIVNVLIRDSVMYFLVMFAAYLTNMLIWVAGPQSLLELPIGFSVALSCVMGNRLILNIRDVNREIGESKLLRQRGGDTSFFTPGDTMTDFESELWSKRAHQSHCPLS